MELRALHRYTLSHLTQVGEELSEALGEAVAAVSDCSTSADISAFRNARDTLTNLLGHYMTELGELRGLQRLIISEALAKEPGSIVDKLKTMLQRPHASGEQN